MAQEQMIERKVFLKKLSLNKNPQSKKSCKR